ncbi:MAG: BlaI/MecI/CopY family transcriptional regulator [Aliiglaciecola sp.]|uniref:BlaI/MecI/CopY family transcriptional regulator n=1 Tax=Aliiglaciecola sp. M165 TaxID=2593649 RepID=UPI00117DFCEF|nr:BlaI/MecI/CopY family transcriptional regulator [Aliiglaciecola sp. M165]TRY29901.1 BlaI/MecI/CopY family transcriptional regulator [Aliiglaciecola sp. M165]
MDKNKTVPTAAELELLKILWGMEPATVRQVHEAVISRHNAAYTTTLKMFQIMHEKGFVRRDESTRAHVYTAIYSQEQTQSSIIKDMLAKAFGGSKFDLVVRALGDSTSSDEIAEIRQLLDSLEKKQK